MKYNIITLTIVCLLGFILNVHASEAPTDMKEFNIKCPSNNLFPEFDRSYHECSHGFANKSCDLFVELFEKLIPEYDCQRSFDSTKDKKYIVPAIWLFGSSALEDYVNLLYKLASNKDKMYSDVFFHSAKEAARNIFISDKFTKILDGHLAEEYLPKVNKLKNKKR